jgi:hypothetical protein
MKRPETSEIRPRLIRPKNDRRSRGVTFDLIMDHHGKPFADNLKMK